MKEVWLRLLEPKGTSWKKEQKHFPLKCERYAKDWLRKTGYKLKTISKVTNEKKIRKALWFSHNQLNPMKE